jgi:OmpA-OmpF porin, OOP family
MKKLNYIAPVAILLLSHTVQATAENPWYAGARIGGTHYTDFNSNLGHIAELDENNAGAGLFLGHNFSSWFAIEGGYTYLGETELENYASIKQEGIDLVGKFTWQLSESFDLFAKAGGFAYFTDGNDNLSGLDDEGFAATAGVGAQYYFTNQLSARAEYQFYNDISLEDDVTNTDISWDTHFYSVSLVYSWGAPEKVVIQEAPVTEAPEVEEVVEEVIVEVAKVEQIIKVEPLMVELPFATESFDLPQTYKDQLKPIVQHLNDYPEAKLYVVGHTDSRGAEKFNQNLSEQRAAAISKYLSEAFSIDVDRIEEQGKGELDPRATNDTKDGRALNRRVSVFTPGLEVKTVK